MTFDAAQLVETKELAAIVGLDHTRIRQLEREGVLTKAARNQFALGPSVQAMLAHARESASKAAEARVSSREAFERERARKLKLENDLREKELLETLDVKTALDFIIGAVKLDLAAVPARVTPLAAEQRRISDAIDDALDALDRRLEKAGADLEAGRDPFAPFDALSDG